MTNAFPPPVVTPIERLGRDVGHLFEVLLFLAVSVFAVTSITEIAARASYLGYLDVQVRSISDELAQNSTSNGPMPAGDALNDLRKTRDVYKHLRGRVESLISVGADSEQQTLISIRQASESVGFAIVRPISEAQTQSAQSFFYAIQAVVNRLNSDYLLAIALMTCGAIGAGVSSIRTSRSLSWRSLLFGLASGFIVFLAIKGGRHVFLLEAHGQTLQFNPYSSGFFGLLAGMFTERTFELLSVITEAVFKKLRKVAEE